MEGRLKSIFLAISLPVIAYIFVHLFNKRRKKISKNSDKNCTQDNLEIDFSDVQNNSKLLNLTQTSEDQVENMHFRKFTSEISSNNFNEYIKKLNNNFKLNCSKNNEFNEINESNVKKCENAKSNKKNFYNNLNCKAKKEKKDVCFNVKENIETSIQSNRTSFKNVTNHNLNQKITEESNDDLNIEANSKKESNNLDKTSNVCTTFFEQEDLNKNPAKNVDTGLLYSAPVQEVRFKKDVESKEYNLKSKSKSNLEFKNESNLEPKVDNNENNQFDKNNLENIKLNHIKLDNNGKKEIDKDLSLENTTEKDKCKNEVQTKESKLKDGCSNCISSKSLVKEKKEKFIENKIVEYSFILPNNLCGLLMGKKKITISSIIKKSNTKISFLISPNSDQYTICCIEGTQKNISIALKLVRKRFPLNLFSDLTLAKINLDEFLKIEAIPHLSQLTLPEGVNCDVILSQIVNAGHIFLQQPTHPTFPLLNNLENYMNSIYNSNTTPDVCTLAIGFICVTKLENKWYRVVIIDLIDNENCMIKFLDYGGYRQMHKKDLKQINRLLMTVPFQACECFLANVKPVNDEWTEEAKNYLKNLLENQLLQCLIVDYTENHIPLVHIYKIVNSRPVLINLELFKSGNATWID